MKDLGEVDTILGIKVKKHSSCYAFNQSYYIEKMIDKFKYLNIKETNTLFDFSMKLND
jgi:ribonuclease I